MKEEYKEIYRSGNEDFEQIFSVDRDMGVLAIETIYHPKYKIDKKITFVTVADMIAINHALEVM